MQAVFGKNMKGIIKKNLETRCCQADIAFGKYLLAPEGAPMLDGYLGEGKGSTMSVVGVDFRTSKYEDSDYQMTDH